MDPVGEFGLVVETRGSLASKSSHLAQDGERETLLDPSSDLAEFHP
jgi:hypothetical protein